MCQWRHTRWAGRASSPIIQQLRRRCNWWSANGFIKTLAYFVERPDGRQWLLARVAGHVWHQLTGYPRRYVILTSRISHNSHYIFLHVISSLITHLRKAMLLYNESATHCLNRLLLSLLGVSLHNTLTAIKYNHGDKNCNGKNNLKPFIKSMIVNM